MENNKLKTPFTINLKPIQMEKSANYELLSILYQD